jgi:hypothetical protein
VRPVRFVLILAIAVAAVLTPARAAPKQFVLSPEGNHLWAYDTQTLGHQLVVRAQNGSDPGEAPPPGAGRRDINGQICVSPDGRHVITGEDTVIPPSGGTGSSHDPRIAGWGYFEISGSSLGEIAVNQVGKLAPEALGTGPGYAGDPDNYGCGFLDADRLVTTAIGDTLPGQPANGQLFLWFGPFDAGFRQETETSGVRFFVGDVPHCQIDGAIPTAGGVAVDDNGDVYVASNRPDGSGGPSGVWSFRGRFPSSPAECNASFLAANLHKELVVPFTDVLPVDVFAPTPSSVVVSPDDTLYVSSVFTGTVSEFTKAGNWVRDIYPLSPIALRRGPTGDTPYGLAITADGALWIADLGIVLNGPVSRQGSVVRVPFGPNRNPKLLAQTVRSGLTFPDGLGVYTPGG